MAEGLLSGIIGNDGEKLDIEAPDALAGAEAFAAAIAARLSGSDPQVARDTSAFLKKQTELLETQNKHLQDEHTARLHFLQGQAREVDIRRFALRLRLGFQLFLLLVASVIGVGAAVMVHDAVTSRSVVIEPIEIAPNIAAQVPSGKIVAAGLLDVLTRIQAASRSTIQRRSLSNAWTGDITIEVPETGVSIGQLERALKTRFGHDQSIEGDLVQTEKGGLALTVRGTGILPKTFADDGRRLEELLTKAGEYVYGQSQPGLWTAYLTNNARNDDAIRFAQTAYTTADSTERPYILDWWANAILGKGGEGAVGEALPLYREALRLKPNYWNAYSNIPLMLTILGDEEGAVEMYEQMIKDAGGRPGRAPEAMYQGYDAAVWDLPASRAGLIADLESNSGVGTAGSAGGDEKLGVAQLDVQMHDVAAAALQLKTVAIDEKNAPDVAAAAFARALLAEEADDFRAAAKEWDTFVTAYANPTTSTSNPQYICYAALAYEKTGQSKKAEAALSAVGALTFVDCYRFRGDLLEFRGDWPGAQSWYARAAKLAPSIPAGYYSWGVALAKHGELDGAAAKFQAAHQKGPHWADPLKAWADVLAKQGRIKEALGKYDKALKFAPNWQQLKDTREALARQKS